MSSLRRSYTRVRLVFPTYSVSSKTEEMRNNEIKLVPLHPIKKSRDLVVLLLVHFPTLPMGLKPIGLY